MIGNSILSALFFAIGVLFLVFNRAITSWSRAGISAKSRGRRRAFAESMPATAMLGPAVIALILGAIMLIVVVVQI